LAGEKMDLFKMQKYLRGAMIGLAACCTLLVSMTPQTFAQPLLVSEVADPALRRCIAQSAVKNNWQHRVKVKELICHGMGIKSLKGIKQFNGLTKLSLFHNELVSVDLTELPNLEYLNLAKNKLRFINIIDLSRLHTLYLFKNKLVEIDLSGLSNLKKIRLTNNLLKSLDISDLAAVEKIYLFDNKLEDLVVRGLPKLKFIELKHNPMPDEVYDRYDRLNGITIIHDGNADDWK